MIVGGLEDEMERAPGHCALAARGVPRLRGLYAREPRRRPRAAAVQLAVARDQQPGRGGYLR